MSLFVFCLSFQNNAMFRAGCVIYDHIGEIWRCQRTWFQESESVCEGRRQRTFFFFEGCRITSKENRYFIWSILLKRVGKCMFSFQSSLACFNFSFNAHIFLCRSRISYNFGADWRSCPNERWWVELHVYYAEAWEWTILSIFSWLQKLRIFQYLLDST